MKASENKHKNKRTKNSSETNNKGKNARKILRLEEKFDGNLVKRKNYM